MIQTSRSSHRTPTLVQASLEVIRNGQTAEGAYLAAPTFPTYRYSWFRDGAFIAEAMDDWEQHDSAEAFHAWVVRTLEEQFRSSSDLDADAPFEPTDALHTRYRADGTPGSEEWPNFQLDGFGTWLWAYRQHLQRTGASLEPKGRDVVRQLSGYLTAHWARPNFDCWEEHDDRIHPSTLGALYAGLGAAAELLDDPALAGTATAIRSYLLAQGVSDGRFVKHVGASDVDANLLWLTIPYGVVEASHPISRATARQVRRDLLDPEGGVHRYRADTYYGGGSWLLLTAALAQDHLAAGEPDEARRLLGWIEGQATDAGHLPEQTARHLNDPSWLPLWEERWGPSACPLLWSHAAYLSLVKRMETTGETA